MTTDDQIAEEIMRHKEITEGFIQRTYGREQVVIGKTGGGFLWGLTASKYYRVCIYTEKKLADESRRTLEEAVTAAFKKLEITLPKKIKDLLAIIQ